MSLTTKSVFLLLALSLCSGISGQVSADSWVNWESPPVHPLELVSGSDLLLATNTADSHLEIYNISSGVPVPLMSVPVGLDPVSVRARNATEAWVVNRISDTISIVDLQNDHRDRDRSHPQRRTGRNHGEGHFRTGYRRVAKVG